MPMEGNGFRTIAALAVLGIGIGWMAYSGITHRGFHHFIVFDTDDSKAAPSGKVVDVERSLGDVHAIRLDGTYNATITIGDSPSLRITADDTVAGQIETRASDGTLRVSGGRDSSSKDAPRLAITLPRLDSLRLTKGAVEVSGLKGDRFDLRVDGTADVTASGSVENATIRVDGTGRLRLKDLNTGVMTIRLDGPGDAEVTATRSLDVRIDGPGRVRYAGTPADVKKRIEGPGAVEAEG